MKPIRTIGRRSFLARVAGGAFAAGGAVAALAGRARAGQVTDSDPTDPIGHGRGTGQQHGPATGYSDSDSGAGADPAGHGRRGGQQQAPATGVTDSDSGAGGDPAGHGRGAGGRQAYQDNDNADPAGNARRPARDVDCNGVRDRLRALEHEIELAEWDTDQMRAAEASLARARALQQQMAQMPRDAWFRGERQVAPTVEIQDILREARIDCTFASPEQCIDRLEREVQVARRGRQNRPRLYGERYQLQEELRRGGC